MSNPKDISLDEDSQSIQPRLENYPKTLFGSQNRSFSSIWLDRYRMLEYSEECDKVFCSSCRHFSKDKTNALVQGFSNWRDLKKVLARHFDSRNSSHQFAHQKYVSYCQSKTAGTIVVQLDAHNKIDIERNREVLAVHVDAVLYCAQQDIALRGHRENEEAKKRGKFVELVELIKRQCPEFAMKTSKMPKNSKLLS